MRPAFFLFAIPALLFCGCKESPVTSGEKPLYLHWFTLDSDQKFIPLHSAVVRLGEEIDSDGLKGKIVKGSLGLHATLEGHYGLSTGKFRNYIELEGLFGPALYDYSGAIHVTSFVVSCKPDSRQFYAEHSRRRSIVPSEEDYTIDLTIPLFAGPEPDR